MIKVLIDENFSRYFAEGLNKLQFPMGNNINVTSIENEYHRGIKDEDWIPKWGEQSGIFITQDLRIYSTKQQSAMLFKYNIGAFFLKLPKGYKYWDKVNVMIRHWTQIVKIIETNQIPFTFFITPKKVFRN